MPFGPFIALFLFEYNVIFSESMDMLRLNITLYSLHFSWNLLWCLSSKSIFDFWRKMAVGSLPRKRTSRSKTISINKKNIAIAFVSQKGGVGKTTTATHARDWFSQFGTVGFIDADAQRSSSNWLGSIDPEIPFEIMGDSETLLKEIPKRKKEYDFLIVDAPGSMAEVSRSIMSRCDLVVIPCQPSQLDLDSNATTLEMVDVVQDIRGGLPEAVLFFNRAQSRTVLLKEAREVIDEALEEDELNIQRLKTVIHMRQCIMDVPGQETTIFRLNEEVKKKSKRSPVDIAKSEYDALFREIVEVINAS